MDIQPINTPPRPLCTPPWWTWYVPGGPCWRSLPPFLASRWQFCFGYWFSPCRSSCSIILPPVYPFDVLPPREGRADKPLDLLWPYEVRVPREEIVYDERTVVRPHHEPGTYLDLLT